MKKITLLTLISFFVVSLSFAQQKTFPPRVTPVTPELQKVPAGVLVATINESFEGTTFPPNGWTKASPDGGTGWEMQTIGTTPIPGFVGGSVTSIPNGSGGPQMAFCTYTTGGASSNDQWLITPQIAVSPNYTLNFWVRKFGSYADAIDVKVSVTGAGTAAFTTTLGTLSYIDVDSGWVQSNYSLSAYAGQNIYIAFNEHVADNATDGAALFLDNVQVSVNAGISNPAQTAGVKIYPNPVNDFMNIESHSNINKLHVANILGSEVLNMNVDNNKTRINTAELNPGVYFVTLETATGNITRKINVTR